MDGRTSRVGSLKREPVVAGSDMAQLLTLANAVVAVLPAAAVFFWAYGRYDGMFRDNVVFLYFIGGLLMGGFLGFMTLLAYSSLGALVAIVLIMVLLPMGLTAGIDRRKWQGERHAIFNGGAFGLGVSVMFAFSLLFYAYRSFSWIGLGQGLLVATGLAGLFFGLGLLAGNGVRLRTQFRLAFLGMAIVLAPVVFLGQIVSELVTGHAWLFPALLALYGAIVGVAAERRLLIEGIAPDSRKERRRRQRAEQA